MRPPFWQAINGGRIADVQLFKNRFGLNVTFSDLTLVEGVKRQFLPQNKDMVLAVVTCKGLLNGAYGIAAAAVTHVSQRRGISAALRDGPNNAHARQSG